MAAGMTIQSRNNIRSPEQQRHSDSYRLQEDHLVDDCGNDVDNDKQEDANESHTRSLIKGLTWRFVATATTIVISLVVTGEIGTAIKIGFVEFFAKIMIYYVHERIWTKIPL